MIRLFISDIDGCLRACRRHLKDNGQLILPTHLPWEMIWDGREECPLEERKRVELADGAGSLLAFQGWRINAAEQRLEFGNLKAVVGK